MMHGSTSPFYPLIASIDVAAAMMDDPAGPTLMSETLQDAISFRKAMSSIAHRLRKASRVGSSGCISRSMCSTRWMARPTCLKRLPMAC